MIPQTKIYMPPHDRCDDGASPQSSPGNLDSSSTDSHAFGFVIPFDDQVAPKNAAEKNKREIAFQSKQMSQLIKLAARYAMSSASVLVTGESGTGKELFSRMLHEKSNRSDGPFLALNCAAVPELLMESVVFGHERGAFTGAVQKQVGYFERANRGTLLLDEISEIPLTLQAKLLRVLEEQEVQPVGGTRVRPVDVRVIATSNRDLRREVAEGRFREDLYYRLNVLDLTIPPLRKRVTDIPLLTMHFLEMYRNESTHGIRRVTKEAMQSLCRYRWPGNVRELRNVIHRACVIALGGEIDQADLPCFETDPEEDAQAGFADNLDALHGMTLADVERKMIVSSLQKFDGNKKHAAEELGVTARTLSNKLKQYREEARPTSISL